VLITNWRPGVAERMGLTAEQVREDFPQLVWVRVSGYGPDGPRAGLPAFDGIVQARSGAMVSGVETPINVNNAVADKVSAMFAAQTVTAALHQRVNTGTGVVWRHLVDDQTVHNQTYQPVDDPSVDGDWLLVRFPSFFDGRRAETAGRAAPQLNEFEANYT